MEAINLLPEECSILLGARLNSLHKRERMGVISQDQASRTRSQIAYSILAEIECEDSNHEFPQDVTIKNNLEGSLKTIIIENKRRRPGLADEARDLLSELQSHNNEKSLSSSYDTSGRRFVSIETRIDQLTIKLSEAKGDAVEDIVSRIASLLSDNIPSYDNLNEAYKLAVGRGMRSEYVDKTLNTKPNDSNAQITVAEKIESFIGNIRIV